MHSNTVTSYWPHMLILIGIVVITAYILSQQQIQQLPTNKAVISQEMQPTTNPALTEPIDKSAADIGATVHQLQAQPTAAPAYTLLYTGPTASLPKNLTLQQNDILAVTNTTPNEILVSFSSSDHLTLGANSSLENTLSLVGKEIITITDGAGSATVVITVTPEL